MTDTANSKQPTPDQAEHNAFFPSPYSLGEFTSPSTPIDGDHWYFQS